MSRPNGPQFLAALLLLGQVSVRALTQRSQPRTTMTTMAKGRGYGVIPGVLQDSGERSGYRRQRAQMCQRGVRSLTPDTSSRVRLDAMNTSRSCTHSRTCDVSKGMFHNAVAALRACASTQALAWIRWAPLDPSMPRTRRPAFEFLPSS